jgi:hypothetical protein
VNANASASPSERLGDASVASAGKSGAGIVLGVQGIDAMRLVDT